jgi:hypothetical protein
MNNTYLVRILCDDGHINEIQTKCRSIAIAASEIDFLINIEKIDAGEVIEIKKLGDT